MTTSWLGGAYTGDRRETATHQTPSCFSSSCLLPSLSSSSIPSAIQNLYYLSLGLFNPILQLVLLFKREQEQNQKKKKSLFFLVLLLFFQKLASARFFQAASSLRVLSVFCSLLVALTTLLRNVQISFLSAL